MRHHGDIHVLAQPEHRPCLGEPGTHGEVRVALPAGGLRAHEHDVAQRTQHREDALVLGAAQSS
ncbi:hypothetical protein GCM10025873_06840 [Demequina sediminis]|nr:hypothetical protein [Demequina sediminis]BDZ60893.1 hypothetical protein GCM10025873_06840 [Demequina sediminis]